MAARAAVEQNLDLYSAELNTTLLPEIRIARLAARALYAAPSFIYDRIAQKPFFAESILDLFSGKTTYKQLAAKALKKPWRLGGFS
jgi:hypothetical protein